MIRTGAIPVSDGGFSGQVLAIEDGTVDGGPPAKAARTQKKPARRQSARPVRLWRNGQSRSVVRHNSERRRGGAPRKAVLNRTCGVVRAVVWPKL